MQECDDIFEDNDRGKGMSVMWSCLEGKRVERGKKEDSAKEDSDNGVYIG